MTNVCTNSAFRKQIKKVGYLYLPSMSKGMLSGKDKKDRHKFASDIKQEFGSSVEQLKLWREDIFLYGDIVGFEYKVSSAKFTNNGHSC